MKKQIRFGVYETNSSMSNALTIMSKKEYDDLLNKCKDKNWMWNVWDEEWVNVSGMSEDEIYEKYDKHEIRYSFFDDEAEGEIATYTTESGDEIVAISQCKWDG